MRSRTRGVLRLVAYLSLTLALLPLQALAVTFGLRLAERLPRFYHRLCTRILGFDVVVRGERLGETSAGRPVLLVCNHVSYLDITDRKSTRLNSSHKCASRMPS